MEKIVKPTNGYAALILAFLFMGGCIYCFVMAGNGNQVMYVPPAVVMLIVGLLILKGLIIVEPNNTRVLTLFGKYVGSVKDNGLFFINPFYTANKLTQRV